MPRACSICTNRSKNSINKALREGDSRRRLATRFNISYASVQRHAANCLGITNAENTPKTSPDSVTGDGLSESARFESDGRCTSCGQSTRGTDAQSVLRRLERTAWMCETLALRAQDNDDTRLVLQAVKELRPALDSLAKSAGLFSDGATVVVRDRFAAMSDAELESEAATLLAKMALVPSAFSRRLASALGSEPRAEIVDVEVRPVLDGSAGASATPGTPPALEA